MKCPPPRCVRLAAALVCLGLAVPSPAAEKEKKAGSKPAAAGKSGKPAKPAPPENPPAPGGLEPVCAALEPLTLRTEMARPLADGKQTLLVPAREDNVLGLTNFSRGEFQAAGLDWDRFLARATAAATRLLATLTPAITKNRDGSIAYATLRGDRPFTASVVLSPEFLPLFREQLGDRLVVLMPDRNTIYVFSRNFGRFQDFGPRILQEYQAALYPCSIEAFEVSRDGLKCLGAFDDGSGAAPRHAAAPPAEKKGRPSAAAPKPSSGKKKSTASE